MLRPGKYIYLHSVGYFETAVNRKKVDLQKQLFWIIGFPKELF
jgi:hypothetical protein